MTNSSYDSAPDTQAHIERVRQLLQLVYQDLVRRATYHDASKLESPEKEMFDHYTPLLKQFIHMPTF